MKTKDFTPLIFKNLQTECVPVCTSHTMVFWLECDFKAVCEYLERLEIKYETSCGFINDSTMCYLIELKS